MTGQIIGAAMAVHRALGPGFVERAYENALTLELEARGISFEQQVRLVVEYRGRPIVEHRVDLIVGGSVVVELKSVLEIPAVHFAIVRSYVRASDCTHGLILNFGRGSLEVKRVTARYAGASPQE